MDAKTNPPVAEPTGLDDLALSRRNVMWTVGLTALASVAPLGAQAAQAPATGRADTSADDHSKFEASSLFPYRAIVDHPRFNWPNGARIAVWVIPNVEHYRLELGPGAPNINTYS